MVGTGNIVVDFGGFEIFFQGFADEEIVDAPTDVSTSGAGAETPPGVFLLARMEKTESVDKTGISQIGDSLSLLFGIAGILFVFLWASEVDDGMGGVKIATNDDGFFLL